jgi:hypothetical protein
MGMDVEIRLIDGRNVLLGLLLNDCVRISTLALRLAHSSRLIADIVAITHGIRQLTRRILH